MSFLLSKCCCGAPAGVREPVWRWDACPIEQAFFPPLYGTDRAWRRFNDVSDPLNPLNKISFEYTDQCSPTYLTMNFDGFGNQVGPDHLNGTLSMIPLLSSFGGNEQCNIPVDTSSLGGGVCGTFTFVGYLCPDATCKPCFCPASEFDGTDCSQTTERTLVVFACDSEGVGVPAGWDNQGFGEIAGWQDFDEDNHAGIWLDLGYINGNIWDRKLWGTESPAFSTGPEDVLGAGGASDSCCSSGCFARDCDHLGEYIGEGIQILNSSASCSLNGGTQTVTITGFAYDPNPTPPTGGAGLGQIRIVGTYEGSWSSGSLNAYCDCCFGTCCENCSSPQVTVFTPWELRLNPCALVSEIGGVIGSDQVFLEWDPAFSFPTMTAEGSHQTFCLRDAFDQGCPPITPVTTEIWASVTTSLVGVDRTGTWGDTVLATISFRLRNNAFPDCTSFPDCPPPENFNCEFPIQIQLPEDPCPV